MYSGPNVTTELDVSDSGTTFSNIKRYAHGTTIDELVLFETGNAQYGVTRNQQWSVMSLYDLASGNVAHRFNYGVFGQRYITNADGNLDGALDDLGFAYGYTSRRHDDESGLMYFRARYYDPATGEFISKDPLEYVDGMSLYRAYFVPGGVDPRGYQNQAFFNCRDTCEKGCYQQFPYWYQYHLWAGCIVGCDLGCKGHVNPTFCDYVNDFLTDDYKDKLTCICGAVDIADAFTNGNPAVTTADCVCEALTGVFNACASGSFDVAIFSVHAADCAVDILNIPGEAGRVIDTTLIALSEGIAWGQPNAKACIPSCIDAFIN